MPSPPDLAVCIVNWNTRGLLQTCLRCAEAERELLALEAVVVDNASTDGSAQMVAETFPWVRLVANPQNRFYAAANNQALALTCAPFALLLNTDVEFAPGSLRDLVAWLREHPAVGAVAPRLVYPDGRLQASCRNFPSPDTVLYEAVGLARLFPRSRRFGKYRMTWWDYASERRVDQPMASALLLRREALDQVGFMDESFPMFFNDVDLCRRLANAGWEVWFTPAVTITHHHGGSTRAVRTGMIVESRRSFLRYYHKHYRGKVSWPAYLLAVGLLRLDYLRALVRHKLAPTSRA